MFRFDDVIPFPASLVAGGRIPVPWWTTIPRSIQTLKPILITYFVATYWPFTHWNILRKHKNIIVSYNFPKMRCRGPLKSFCVEDKNLFLLHSQQQYWVPIDTMRKSISNRGVDLVILKYDNLSTDGGKCTVLPRGNMLSGQIPALSSQLPVSWGNFQILLIKITVFLSNI